MRRRAGMGIVLAAWAGVAIGRPAAAGETLGAEAAGVVVTARQAIQRAMDHGSASELLGARAALLSLSETEQEGVAVRYTQAYLHWRLVPLWLREHEDQRETALRYADEGVEHARALQRLEPKNAEAWAIESSLLGLKMMSPEADVMTLGPASMQAMSRAVKLAPANPRVLLLQGMSLLHTPPQFGGGAKPAIAVLQKAVAALAADVPADSLSPAWGHDDAHAWLAQAYMQNDQYPEAAAALAEAAALNPASGMVKGLQRALQVLAPAEPPAAAGGSSK